MPAFSYEALSVEGKKLKGVIEGDSARQVRQILREKGLKPLEVNTSSSSSKEKTNSTSVSKGFRSPRMNVSELALFTRQLATLVNSNLPLAESLQAVAEQSEKASTKGLVLEIRSKIVEGHTLAYALGEFPRIFNHMYRAMVQAGERAGFLGSVLERLADYTESSQFTQQKIRQAMIYPFVLMLVAFSVISALMILVVPKLVKVFETSNAELPMLTQALLAISDYMVSYGLVSILVIIAIGFAISKFVNLPANIDHYHAFLLRLPIIGPTIRTANSARFSSTLSILLASGVPLLESVKIAGAVLTNNVLKNVCGDIALAVKEGGSFSRSLAMSGQFPPMLVHMVASGEASGELETMLERVANNQERELEARLATLMGIMEPALIVTMGGFVLLIVLAILQPIFEMNKLI